MQYFGGNICWHGEQLTFQLWTWLCRRSRSGDVVQEGPAEAAGSVLWPTRCHRPCPPGVLAEHVPSPWPRMGDWAHATGMAGLPQRRCFPLLLWGGTTWMSSQDLALLPGTGHLQPPPSSSSLSGTLPLAHGKAPLMSLPPAEGSLLTCPRAEILLCHRSPAQLWFRLPRRMWDAVAGGQRCKITVPGITGMHGRCTSVGGGGGRWQLSTGEDPVQGTGEMTPLLLPNVCMASRETLGWGAC